MSLHLFISHLSPLSHQEVSGFVSRWHQEGWVSLLKGAAKTTTAFKAGTPDDRLTAGVETLLQVCKDLPHPVTSMFWAETEPLCNQNHVNKWLIPEQCCMRQTSGLPAASSPLWQSFVFEPNLTVHMLHVSKHTWGLTSRQHDKPFWTNRSWWNPIFTCNVSRAQKDSRSSK